ncbi:M43 family zinc metalloprotease [Flavobacterium sp. U410]
MRNFLIISGLLYSVFLIGQNQNLVSLNNTTSIKQPVTFGQNLTPSGHIRCHSTEYESFLKTKYPKRATTEQFEAWLVPKIAQIKADRAAGRNIQQVYNIPVVIHIIHNGDALGTGENITDAQAISQINVMNEDYRRLAGTPGGVNSTGLAVDCEINFCLAQTDPNGNPTTGIVRHVITPYSNNVADGAGGPDWETFADADAMKAATIWNPDNYLNMWTIRPGGRSLELGGMSGLLGYAQFPDASGLPGLATTGGAANTDGVVAAFNAMGTIAENDGTFILNATYNLGRTMTHEVGHWLGLRHIWGDGGCTVDDFCPDTPVAGQANYSCSTVDSCPTDPGNDMIQNYMDYTNDACMDTFTQNQKDRMVAVMTNSPRRNTLNASTACQAPAPYIKFGQPTGSINEGTNCNYSDYNFPVTIARVATANADVTFTVTGGTATQNIDYSIVNSTVTFPEGTTTDQYLTIRVYNDGLVETDETIQVQLSVNANGGDALVNSGSTTMDITLFNDDFAPNPLQTITVFEEDFEDITGWTRIDQDGDSYNWGLVTGLDGYGTAPNTITGKSAFSEKSLSYLRGSNTNVKPNNYLISPQITLPAGVNSISLSYILAGYDDAAQTRNAGNLNVYFTTDASSETTILAGTVLASNLIINEGTSVLNIHNLTALSGQTGYIVFRHVNTSNTTNIGLLLVDTMLIEAEISTDVQTEVNNATRYLATIPTSGQVYASDSATSKIMTGINSSNAFDYGCVTVEVDRSQTSVGAPSAVFVDPNTQNYLLSKTYFVDPANDTNSGNYTISFYFTEAEVAAWETVTGKTRSELKIIKVIENPISLINATNFENYTIEEIPVTIGAFGANVIFSATFSSKLGGGYAIGPTTGTVCGDLVSTWDGTTWDNGVPTKFTAAVFSANYSSTTDLEACTVTVNSGAGVVFNPGHSLVVTGTVDVVTGSMLTIENSASLIQKQEVANTGDITVKRDVSIAQSDYVFWSTPVANFNAATISTDTPTDFIWKWVPTVVSNTNGYGIWVNGNETMVNGKGYIVRGPNTFGTLSQTFTADFVGAPNNGTITMAVSRGTYTGADYNTGNSSTLATNNDDNWNLIGNPYPSAVNAIRFLNANTNIDGFINIWTHSTAPANTTSTPFYGTYLYNYSVSDYITYNALGASSGPATFNGNIASAQGFFVKMSDSSVSTTESVTFTNSMRDMTYLNNQFFRTTQDLVVSEEKNNIWIDLVSVNTGKVRRALIGYIEGAEEGIDRLYDAPADNKKEFNLYSLVNDQKMIIQGKGLPFQDTDVVPLGIKIPQDGNYVFAIGAVEGLFEGTNQNIYLEDYALDVVHNLRNSPYSFNTSMGTIDNRFALRYTSYLKEESVSNSETNIWVNTKSYLTINSVKENISEVMVYDVLGRTVAQETNQSSIQIELNKVQKNNSLLILQITLEDGKVITKKVIY